MCQDANEPEDETFRSFWIKPVTNEPGSQYYDTLEDDPRSTPGHSKLLDQDSLDPVRAIMKLRQYGYCIFGLHPGIVKASTLIDY